MRKFLMISAALAALATASPGFAQSADTDATAGAAAGGVAGGIAGFFLGGPIGAIIGGWTGAVIGAEAAVPDVVIRYAGEHPVEPVRISGEINVGYKVGDEISIHAVEGSDRYGYFYANNRVWIVDLETHEVVMSPGYTLRQADIEYVRAHQQADISYTGTLTVGSTLDGDFELFGLPDDETYAYVYVGGRPVLVDRTSRVILWIGD